MLDIFAIARGNSTAVETAFEAMVARITPEHSALVREFVTWVQAETLISINVKLFVIIEFLNGQRYQNIYEWAQEQSRLSGRTVEEALRERLQQFYDLRMAFDHAFKDGERFAYGALNAGGGGLPEYAPYCVVLARSFQESLTEAAWLPGDSLKICFGSSGSFNTEVIERRAAPHTHRHLMVAIERASEISAANKPDWPSLVASTGRYFEGIFIGDISLDTVDCVRVSRAEYERMWNLAFGSFGTKLDEAGRALVQDFVQLRRGEVDGKIRIEVVG